MAKVNISATIDEKIVEKVNLLSLPEAEDRSFSKMIEILLKEALKARGIKSK